MLALPIARGKKSQQYLQLCSSEYKCKSLCTPSLGFTGKIITGMSLAVQVAIAQVSALNFLQQTPAILKCPHLNVTRAFSIYFIIPHSLATTQTLPCVVGFYKN